MDGQHHMQYSSKQSGPFTQQDTFPSHNSAIRLNFLSEQNKEQLLLASLLYLHEIFWYSTKKLTFILYCLLWIMVQRFIGVLINFQYLCQIKQPRTVLESLGGADSKTVLG